MHVYSHKRASYHACINLYFFPHTYFTRNLLIIFVLPIIEKAIAVCVLYSNRKRYNVRTAQIQCYTTKGDRKEGRGGRMKGDERGEG